MEKTIETHRISLLDKEESNDVATRIGLPHELTDFNSFKAFLHSPQGTEGLLSVLRLINAQDDPEIKRIREFAALRIGWSTNCSYMWGQHWKIGKSLGIPAAHLLASRDWKNAECFSEHERAVLAATDDLLEYGVVSDTVWALYSKYYSSPRAQVEGISMISGIIFFSMVLRSLSIPLEKSTPFWAPDGVSPTASSVAFST